MNLLRVIGITTDIFCLLLCGIEIAALFLWYKTLDKSGKYFFAIIFSCGLSILSNLFGLIYKGDTAWYAHGILLGSNFCEFASGIILSFVFTMYVINSVDVKGPKSLYRKLVFIFCSIAMLLLVVSQFNHMYYFIDASNIYHRGNLFFLSQFVGILLMVINLFILFVHHKKIPKRELAAMLVYILLPAAALILQLFFYGVYLLLIAESISITIMFMLILTSQVEAYYAKEKQISDMQILLGLSQIQPHFLYNSLTAIKYLCKNNPDEAAVTIDKFSSYLRANMTAINTNHCISFMDELNHVMNYLHIEEKRFGKRLSVTYDLQENHFHLPPLTIQPIVENAVKYGTMHNVDGVHVNIATHSDEENYYIFVQDDGPGFQPSEYNNDGKSHVGILSVKTRLASMCSGRLEITSTPENGTLVKMIIPKGAETL